MPQPFAVRPWAWLAPRSGWLRKDGSVSLWTTVADRDSDIPFFVMILVDTSAWIEWLIGSLAGNMIAGHLSEREAWVVPTLVQLELTEWLSREVGEDKADQVIAFTQVCQVVPLDTEIALAAAEACRVHRLATTDAIVFATARVRGATLLTCDSH